MSTEKEDFKPREPRKYIGTYRPRIDGKDKASGRTEFVDDITLKRRFPDMLYAKVLRSPYAHARIKSLDITWAEQVPGVKGVLTYRDPEIIDSKPTNAGWTDGCETVNYDRMFFPQLRDRKILSDHACLVGDALGVVVAAENEQAAEEALKLLEIEWEVLPFVLDPREALKPEAPVIHPEISPDSNILPEGPIDGPRILVDRGEVDRAFREADVTVDVKAHYHNPYQGVLENWTCLAWWQGDKLTVWSNTFEADQTRMHLSEMLDLPINKVRAITPYVGGSHGRGDNGDQPFFLFTALLAKRTGRPVKFRHRGTERFHDARTAHLGRCRLAATQEGMITGCHIEILGDSGGYADHTYGSAKLVTFDFMENSLAHIPGLRVEVDGVYTNKIPGSCKRGIGHVQLNFLVGRALDELAERLDMDPLELGPNNFNSEFCTMPNESLAAILKEGSRRIGWDKRHKTGQGPTKDGGKKRGMGMSFHNGWHANWQEIRRGPLQVIIRINRDGTINLDAPTIETGPGSNCCAAFACADALGVRLEDINWISTVDTEMSGKDQVQTDSAVSHILPEIITVAAKDAKRKLFECAAPELGEVPDKLDIEDSRIFVKADPDRGILLKDLLRKGDLVPIVSSVEQYVPGDKTGVPFVAAFADVEVDTETGFVEVKKLVILNDCGTVMYPTGAEGQQIGGQSHGLGEALTEEMIYDPATGVPLNFNWIDYKMPTMLDFPDIDPVAMEVWRGVGEYGACGIGESVLACTPRAIANAVYNATGARVDHLPITPDKVLNALGKI